MRCIPPAALAATLCVGLFGGTVFAGQTLDINSLPAGTRYCPAPWANNSEFLDTHYGMDAKTGVITKHTGNMYPEEELNGPQTEERVLYVSPPISVENRFVPPPGYQGPPPRQSQPQPYQAPQPRAVQNPQPQYRQPVSPGYTASRPVQGQNRRPSARPAKTAPRVSEAAPQQRSNQQSGKLPWWKAIFRN